MFSMMSLVKERLADNAAATDFTFNDPDEPTCITAATDSVPAVPASVETSPAAFQRQIQELAIPFPSSTLHTVVEVEADALQNLQKGKYKYGFGCYFESCIPTRLSKATARRFSGLKVEPERMMDFHLGPVEYTLRAIPFSSSFSSYGPEFAQAVEKKEPVAGSERERQVAFVRGEVLGASGCIFIGDNLKSRGFRLVTNKYALLDDDPESGFTHHDAPLRAIGHVG